MKIRTFLGGIFLSLTIILPSGLFLIAYPLTHNPVYLQIGLIPIIVLTIAAVSRLVYGERDK